MSVIHWNEKFGNKSGMFLERFDGRKKLMRNELAMIQEELDELTQAMDDHDRREILDACIDIIYVTMGTLHKFGFNEHQIAGAFGEVCRSNLSKLGSGFDTQGKAKKGIGYQPPQLDKYI